MSNSELPNETTTLPLTDAASVELALSKMIDDELTAQQERQLLQFLDQHSQYWRDCALAFVAERALRRGSRSWVLHQQLETSTAPAPATLSVVPTKATAGTPWAERIRWAVGLAAALLLGLVIRDYWPHDFGSSNTTKPNQIVNKQPPAPAVEKGTNTELPQGVRMEFVNSNNESTDSVDVPLVPVNHVDENLLQSWQQASQINIPSRILQQLEQEGQTVQQQNSWMPITLPTGQQALVPIQRVRIVPRHSLAQ
jgi:hypothetical protein